MTVHASLYPFAVWSVFAGLAMHAAVHPRFDSMQQREAMNHVQVSSSERVAAQSEHRPAWALDGTYEGFPENSEVASTLH